MIAGEVGCSLSSVRRVKRRDWGHASLGRPHNSPWQDAAARNRRNHRANIKREAKAEAKKTYQSPEPEPEPEHFFTLYTFTRYSIIKE